MQFIIREHGSVSLRRDGQETKWSAINASTSVQTPLVHLDGELYASIRQLDLLALTLPQHYNGTKIARKRLPRVTNLEAGENRVSYIFAIKCKLIQCLLLLLLLLQLSLALVKLTVCPVHSQDNDTHE